MSARRCIAPVLSPRRAAGTLAKADGSPTVRAMRLASIIKSVLLEAVAAGGSSLRDHRQTDGSLGYFQHSFKVYDRVGDPCPNLKCSGMVQADRAERPLDVLLRPLPALIGPVMDRSGSSIIRVSTLEKRAMKHPDPGNNPNVGPDPVKTEPNHVREKTYEDPTPPKDAEIAANDLPEKTAQDQMRTEMPVAIDAIKKRV